MQRAKVGIVGASGYSGVELTRLLAGHSGVELVACSSDRWLGATLAKHAGVVGVTGMLRYVANDAPAFDGCDVVLLATPAEASLALAPRLLERGVRVVDLSGAFRLRDGGAYPTWYGFVHGAPGLLAGAAYGMPELGRAAIGAARLVANPGCYATAATLALAPLLAAGVITRDALVVDAMSGTTGAGRQASEVHSFSEVDGDARAYRVLKHQHTPEINQSLGAEVVFTAHLVPLRRGILATAHAQLLPGLDAAAVAETFEAIYGDEPFVQLAASPEDVKLHAVVGTNRCLIGWAVSPRGHVVVMAAIDNLLKGAAGQAVQNLNLMLGHPETTGLTGLRPHH
ncbi:MAG: N-acetyl-gamma-glutamyl-phosphate reductase [Proteobacteria bacterium]|nr:N-acetyl-gamma-glutamyl-phosphate reductase [Pseudomonadota bacterium]